jgi:hypothetical protein
VGKSTELKSNLNLDRLTSAEDVLEDLLWRFVVEWRDAGEELVHANPQSPPVDFLAMSLPGEQQ